MNKSSTTILSVILIVLIVIVYGVIFSILKNRTNLIPGVKIEINTAKPSVIKCNCKETGFLKRILTVTAIVQNYGGDGKVLVTFHVKQDGKDYDRTKSIYMRNNEQEIVEVPFSEVTYLGSDVQYLAEAEAQ
jgi:hypothetical protein